MQSSCARLTALMLLMMCVLATSLRAQTSGEILGRVVDASGTPADAAVVTTTSPQLPGARTTRTDVGGRYHLPALPPGTYVVKVDSSGLGTASKDQILVFLDQSTVVDFELRAAASSPSASQPIPPAIGRASVDPGMALDRDLFTRLALERNIYGVTRLLPGVDDDGVGPAAHGSTGAENQYVIDGLNVTGIQRGEPLKYLNVDVVDELNVRTDGLPAEYGRMTGAMLSVLTKAGGNSFQADLFGYAQPSARNRTAGRTPETTTTIIDRGTQWDVGFGAGGSVVRDALWFYGSYDEVHERERKRVIRDIPNAPVEAPSAGAVEPLDIHRHTFTGKLTYAVRPNQMLVGSIVGDPGTRQGAIFPIQGPASTFRGTLATGGVAGVLRYDAFVQPLWFTEVSYGRHQERALYGGLGTTLPRTVDSQFTPASLSGGFGFYADTRQYRDQVRAAVTRFEGPHTLKAGSDFEHVVSHVRGYQGGAGQQIHRFSQGGTEYYRHQYYVDNRAPDFNRVDSSTWQMARPLVSDPVDFNIALFLQDTFRPASNLTIDAGLRWERQRAFGRDRAEAAFSLTNWAARLSAVFVPGSGTHTRVFGSYGRFFETVPMDINIRSFADDLTCFCYNDSASAADLAPAPATPVASNLFSAGETVDSPLKGQYLDAYALGIERDLATDLVVSLRFNYRRLGRVIEDFATPSDTYLIGNPGDGTAARELTFYDYSTVTAPRGARAYQSLQFSTRKHFSRRWLGTASYVWSRLRGNHDGPYQSMNGQLDPNINTGFDFGDFLINAEGPLTNERRHQVKLDGSYEWSGGQLNGLVLGLSTRYLSGTPLTAFGYFSLYDNWEYFLTPRGSLGRNPGDWEADFHAAYPLNSAGRFRKITVALDVFNLFNRQAITTLDQRYNLPFTPACSGIPPGACNGDNGLLHDGATLAPVSQLANPRETATNVDFLKAGSGFTAPLSVRVGARVSF
jgi:hypothetical protein